MKAHCQFRPLLSISEGQKGPWCKNAHQECGESEVRGTAIGRSAGSAMREPIDGPVTLQLWSDRAILGSGEKRILVWQIVQGG